MFTVVFEDVDLYTFVSIFNRMIEFVPRLCCDHFGCQV